MNNHKYMTVGELAKKMGTTVRTLQFYDQKGLLHPSSESEGGRRLYTYQDMILLHQIQSLKSLGFTLDDIKNRIEVLDAPQKEEHGIDQQEIMIEEKTKIESRACVLGHTQRGGTPTAFDRWLSTLYGTKALDMVLEGKFGYMASLRAFQMQEVKIADAISKLKRVDPHGEEVKAALEVGMSFGSADIG